MVACGRGRQIGSHVLTVSRPRREQQAPMDVELVAAIRSGDRELARRLLAAGANRGVSQRTRLPAQYADIAMETKENDASPWRMYMQDGRCCYVHNLRDSDGNDLRDDEFTLGRPQWHWWGLSHSGHPVATGVRMAEEIPEHEFAQLLKKAKDTDAHRKARAIQTLWYAALKFNSVIARRAASMSKAGQGSGWHGGRQLRAARLKVPRLNAYEFGQFVDTALFSKPRLATRFFQLLDTDNDGESSSRDWEAAIELMCSSDRGRRVAFLFDLVDPGGSGQLCQIQTTGRDKLEGRQIDEAAVNYFFRKFLVTRDDTVDVVLASVERYFGLAPSNTEKRGDGRKVTGAHLGMLGTHRPTARAVGIADPCNQGVCDEQGLEHADFFRATDKQERLDRARKQLGRHDPRYREASTATIELRELLSQHAKQLLGRVRKRLARDVFEAADLDRSGAIDRTEFGNYIAADPRLLQWLENTGNWWIELGGLIAAREMKEQVRVGTIGLVGLDLTACAGEGSMPSTVLLQEAIEPHLSRVSFNKLLKLQRDAIKDRKAYLTRSEWVIRAAAAGLRHVRLAEALFDVWTKTEDNGSEPSTEKDVKVKVQELVCGLAMLDPGQAGDSGAVTRFTFELIDIDSSQEIEPIELAQFLRLFRLPIFASAQRSLAGFYRLCGFKEEYQKIISSMLDLCIQRCITIFVDHAFKSSDENVDYLMTLPEFKEWCTHNALSGFVLNQMQSDNLITLGELSKQKQAEWLHTQAGGETMSERLHTLEQALELADRTLAKVIQAEIVQTKAALVADQIVE